MKRGSPEEELIRRAREARSNAYSPYSGVKIGAAVLARDGSIYAGCNIENSSYGLSNCAERTAIFKAISEGRRELV
ncbi:MAG: cytidine deaminase, partial [Thaumarchaeota archaeon]